MTSGSPHANELLGWTLVSSGRIDEGIRSLEHAYELDPLSDFMLYNFAGSLLFVGEGKRALDLLRPALARSSGNGVLHQLLGVGLMVTDRLPEARAALERARELTPASTQWRGALVCVLAAMGDTQSARDRLSELEDLAERGGGSAFEVGCAYHALGDDEVAYAWLERSFRSRENWMTWLHLDPRLRRLHGDPRFAALVRRVGVAPKSAVNL